MEKYKSEICPTCNNKECNNNIVKSKVGKIVVIKCKDYKKEKTDNKKYLSKYINELRLRKYRNDY